VAVGVAVAGVALAVAPGGSGSGADTGSGTDTGSGSGCYFGPTGGRPLEIVNVRGWVAMAGWQWQWQRWRWLGGSDSGWVAVLSALVLIKLINYQTSKHQRHQH
jgi:hypothetical protein